MSRVRNKHCWTTQEDKALIEALVELSMNTMWRGRIDLKMATYINQGKK